MKKSIIAGILASLSLSAFSGVDVLLSNGKVKRIEEDLVNIRLGDSKNDGESVAKIIGFINKNSSDLVEGSASKIYFRPNFDGDSKSGQGRIYFSKGTASVRLEQAFYFQNAKGEKVYVPFEGAEVNVYIAGLQDMAGKPGVVHKGKVLEISSSLINVDFAELKSKSNENIERPVHLESSLEDRIQLLDILSSVDSGIVLSKMGGMIEKTKDEDLIKRILNDEKIFDQIIKDNEESMSPIYVKTQSGEFKIIWRIRNLYGLPLDLDLSTDGKGSIIHDFESRQKHINVNIYTGSSFNLKKKKRRSGKSYVWKDREVEGGLFKQEDYDIALINLSKVVEYFKNTFNWNSFDNKGSDLDATVRFKGSKLFGTAGLRQNAAWAGAPYNQFLFGRGGDTLGDFLNAFDVIGHEYCHAIVTNTANLDDGNQHGALNEHICDIMGVGFEGDLLRTGFDFKIGESVVLDSNKGLRDFLNPSASFSEQPSHMRQVNRKFGQFCVPTESNDKCGVHYSNGVLNLAVGLMVRDLGWNRMKDLVFEVLTKKLRSQSDFKDYKTQMVRTCNQSGSFSEQDCGVVDRHFASVGLSDAVDTSPQSEGAASGSEMNFESQLCEVVMGTCSLFESGEIYNLCKKCGHEY